MYYLKQLSRKFGKFIRAKFDFYSLEFRLTFGIVLIFTLGLTIFTHILKITESDIYLPRLLTLSLIYNTTMIILVSVFIKRSLIPLRKLEIDVINQDCYFRKKIPTEVKVIAKNWNLLLTRVTEIQQQQLLLLNNLSHELRTPLTMVYGYLERSLRLRSDNLTQNQQEALKMALEEAERMIEILEDLLALARAENGVIISLNLNDLVTDVVEMSEKLKHRPFKLKLPSFPVIVKADSKQLMFVLNELLDNACNYSNVDKPIIVEVTQTNEWGIIEVRDRGCGIPVAEQSRIFESFYRVDASRTRTTGGSGLGLSLVKKSVENMGGKVEVKSNLGEGSTFIVTLPTSGVKP